MATPGGRRTGRLRRREVKPGDESLNRGSRPKSFKTKTMKPSQGLNESRGVRPGRREIDDGPHRRREHPISAREEERRRPPTGAASGTGRLVGRVRRVLGVPRPPEPPPVPEPAAYRAASGDVADALRGALVGAVPPWGSR